MSYTEGLGRAIGESMSVGLKPLIYHYRGAKEQWGKYLWEKPEQIKDLLKEHNSKEYREFMEQNRSIKQITKRVDNLLAGIMQE